jgi:anti-sigma factor ChrR (cupin superfamily)
MTEETHELAALYALGALTQHEARAVETMLDEPGNALADEIAAFESVVAELAFAADERAPSPVVRKTLLTRISDAVPASSSSGKEFHLPFAANDFSQMFSLRADEGEWMEFGPGLSAKTLFVDEVRGLVTSLVKMAPGGALPPHRHKGEEQFYVLEGDCNVHGTRLNPGDFHRAAPGSTHESTYTIGGTTLLLIAPADYEILQPATA